MFDRLFAWYGILSRKNDLQRILKALPYIVSQFQVSLLRRLTAFRWSAFSLEACDFLCVSSFLKCHADMPWCGSLFTHVLGTGWVLSMSRLRSSLLGVSLYYFSGEFHLPFCFLCSLFLELFLFEYLISWICLLIFLNILSCIISVFCFVFIYLFIFACVGSSLLHVGFL